jgi:hypothetical protein
MEAVNGTFTDCCCTFPAPYFETRKSLVMKVRAFVLVYCWANSRSQRVFALVFAQLSRSQR